MNQVYFVTGIDTNIGKSYATGYLATLFAKRGLRVITQKFIQTGNTGVSEDILLHRKIMGIGLQAVDTDGTTCPLVFSYPASPHLAAAMDNITIDLNHVSKSTALLKELYDVVLIEGAGGIMVPINHQQTTIDYIVAMHLPLILVTTPRLGSINHTLLTLDACKSREVKVKMLAYNSYLEEDHLICQDTRDYLQNYLVVHFPGTEWMEVPFISI